MRDFAKIAAPLHSLADKSKSWSWNEQCEQAFNILKYHLTSTPVLILPRYDQEIILDVDASGGGLGAVFSQIIDDKEYVLVELSSRLRENIVPLEEKCLLRYREFVSIAPRYMGRCLQSELITMHSGGYKICKTPKVKLLVG